MAKKWMTGVCAGANGGEWTVLRRGKEGWGVEKQGSWGEEGPGEASKEWKGWLAAGLGAGESLWKAVRLPTGDADEAREMAEFQADRYSPYALEGMGLGVEVLKSAGEETVAGLAMATNEAIEGGVESLKGAGGVPDGVDLTMLGWWRALRDAGKGSDSGEWLGVRVEAGGGASGVLARDGAVLWTGALPEVPGDEAEWGEWARECAEEAGYAMTSAEAEWGGGGKASGTVFGGGGAGKALAEALGLGWEDGDGARASEGVARRFLEGGGVNLAPASWAEADAERRFRRGFWRTAAAVALLWAAAVGAFLGALNARRAGLAKLEAEVRALEAPALEVRGLRAKLGELAAYADRSASPLECLRVVAETLPDGIEMNSFVYAKGQDVKIRGEARRAEMVYDFVTALEKTGAFPEVRNDGISTKNGQNAYSVTLVLPGGGAGEGGAP